MCADRGNDRVAYLCKVYQPPVLRSLKFLIGEGNKGEDHGWYVQQAAAALLIQSLLSFGLDRFSVSAPSVPAPPARPLLLGQRLGQMGSLSMELDTQLRLGSA